MPSNNKTPNLGLNKWEGNEYPKRQDFVEDNEKIDKAFKDMEDNLANAAPVKKVNGKIGDVVLKAEDIEGGDGTSVASQLANITTYQTSGGTSTAITLDGIEFIDGYSKTFIVSNNNNGSATTINGKNLYKQNTTTSPKLKAGTAVTIWYRETNDCFFIRASATGNAQANDVLAGKTFSRDDGTDINGTMRNNGSLTVTPNKNTQSFANGYYSSVKVNPSIGYQVGDKIFPRNVTFHEGMLGSVIMANVTNTKRINRIKCLGDYIYATSYDNNIKKISFSDMSTIWKKQYNKDYMHGIDTDNHGNIYTSAENTKITKLSPSGSTIWEYTAPDRVNDLVFDRIYNMIYVCINNKTIIKLNLNGNYMDTFHLNHTPIKITIHGAYLYIGTYSGEIIKMTTSGSIQWTSTRINDCVFGLAIDYTGSYVYFTIGEWGHTVGALRKLSANNGSFQWATDKDSNNHDFGLIAYDVAVDKDGYSYVGISEKYLVKIDSEGNAISIHRNGYNDTDEVTAVELSEDERYVIIGDESGKIKKVYNSSTYYDIKS